MPYSFQVLHFFLVQIKIILTVQIEIIPAEALFQTLIEVVGKRNLILFSYHEKTKNWYLIRVFQWNNAKEPTKIIVLLRNRSTNQEILDSTPGLATFSSFSFLLLPSFLFIL